MNYTELVAAIKDYTQNEEASFVSNVPSFVGQAEERLNRSIMVPELRKNVSAATTNGNWYLARPADFLSVFSLAVVDSSGNYSFLLDKDVNFIREAYPASSTSGLPEYYAQFDGDYNGEQGNFILGPTPDAAYTVELHYYYDPPSIVTTSTSWYGDNAESALLYGSLIEAYTYMKGETDLIQLYTTRYNEALGQLTGVQIRSQTDEYRDGRL
ncbi:MAG: hypothetical protein CMJ25_11890 [Phycisphaerae bacterium]|nr:hypothetical protein [Phycisphaerae bacterium]|tara:strand:+ start:1607 stop:2242 length:636 start_codon:yes stop_codon:yes gene_type:complete